MRRPIRYATAESFLVQLAVPINAAAQVEHVLEPNPPRNPERAGSEGVAQCQDGLSKLVGPARWDEEACHLGLDHFPVAADIGGHDGQTGRHGLQQGQGDSLADGR